MKFFSICLLTLVSFTSFHVRAQFLRGYFTRLIGGVGEDRGLDAIFDKRDNSIVFTGSTKDGCGTGDLPPCPTITGYEDLLVGKIDSNGNIIWLKQYGGSKTDKGYKIIPTFEGGYAIAGVTSSTDGDANTNLHEYDYWLINLDGNGDLLWQKTYGSAIGDEEVTSCIQTTDKGYVLIGKSTGVGDDVPFQYVQSPFAFDWFIVKTDSLGNKQWTKTFGGTKDDNNICVLQINDKYYLAGSSRSHDHECNDNFGYPSNVNTEEDFYLICLDSTGNYLWNKSYGGSFEDIFNDALYDSRDNTITMVGYSGSKDYMVPPFQTDGYDLWLIKIDLEGNLRWSKTFGDNSLEWYSHIDSSPVDNGYIISCIVQPRKPVPAYYIGDYDVRIFIIDSSGNSLTDKIVGGIRQDFNGKAIAIKNDFAVVGSTLSEKFIEGTTTPMHQNSEIFISYLDYWPLASREIQTRPVPFSIYPNPTSEMVTVELSQQKGNLFITDITGGVIWEQKISSGTNKIIINTYNWARGLYQVVLETADGFRKSQKLTLE